MSASWIAPASARPGSQEMAGLEPEEGHAGARFDRRAADLAGFPVDSGGNVDREHPAAGARESVDALDDRFRVAIDVTGEAGPEQSVDHAIGSGEVDRSGCVDRPLVASSGERRIAFQGLAWGPASRAQPRSPATPGAARR